uniref:VQ domain-containing protein n=1 Tax=Cajanus cajan TaxID=3821 RepID=A0A151RWB4_CAJCA|nr:hypothetical protein KK1_031545 [Cajanus cajan]
MGLRRESPKIVQIETRYVQTDAVNFRDVVQSLTGKNSSTDWIGRNSVAVAGASASEIARGGVADETLKIVGAASHGTKETTLPSPMQMNNVDMSFQDFDGLMFPPMEMMP